MRRHFNASKIDKVVLARIPTKEEIDWVVNSSCSRHKDPERVMKELSLKQLARVFITQWEFGPRLSRRDKNERNKV